ncbi:hypothetical protein JCGZ_26525 [Jatropha curcas]|uniref:Uncharacterized protein n=1 Tax=Jatropha curcas TaxID=180498 RepID=A0A067JKR9_JATCU|nr:hypothetical protein JCGZ_26525 [Jatropha curcas]
MPNGNLHQQSSQISALRPSKPFKECKPHLKDTCLFSTKLDNSATTRRFVTKPDPRSASGPPGAPPHFTCHPV